MFGRFWPLMFVFPTDCGAYFGLGLQPVLALGHTNCQNLSINKSD